MITIILLDDNFKPVPLAQATKAKVLSDDNSFSPYFIIINKNWIAPADVLVLDGTQKGEQ